MDITGLDYNTGRERLLMPEYGREVQRMVDHAVALPTREQRQQCAAAIVKVMENRVPQVRQNAGYEHTLWDHLYLMSGGRLDIEWPYDVSQAEKMQARPERLELPDGNIRLRHYGRLVQQLLDQLRRLPDCPERDELVRLTANQMKRDLMQWGHGSINDERVANDMALLTDGEIQLDLSAFTLERVRPTVAEPGHKGKKKKK